MKKYIKWGGIVLASPFILFIVLCILIYIPAIQNFIVDKANHGYQPSGYAPECRKTNRKNSITPSGKEADRD